MDTNELQAYYDQRQKEYKAYLETELQKFKDANNKYLSDQIADACEHAKILFEQSNESCFRNFLASKKQADDMRARGSDMTAGHVERSGKNMLERSMEFNKKLFEQSVAYYKGLLKN